MSRRILAGTGTATARLLCLLAGGAFVFAAAPARAQEVDAPEPDAPAEPEVDPRAEKRGRVISCRNRWRCPTGPVDEGRVNARDVVEVGPTPSKLDCWGHDR